MVVRPCSGMPEREVPGGSGATRGVLVMIEKLEPGGHGISLDDMIDEMTADGFRLISRHSRWGRHDNHHAAVFAPSR